MKKLLISFAGWVFVVWALILVIIVFLTLIHLTVGCGPPPKVKTSNVKGKAVDEPERIEVFKNSGDSTTIYLRYVPTQSSFDGIAVESSTVLDGPYTDFPLRIAKTDTSVTFPAPDPPMFFRPYYYKLTAGTKTRVAASHNVVKISQSPAIPPGPIPPTPEIGPAPVITVR